MNLGDGTFAEAAAAFGADSLRDARGVAVADFTGDGGLDLLVNNDRSRAQLFVNRVPRGHWLRLRLTGRSCNRDAIGALVRVTAGGVTQTRVISAGDGYASQSSRIAHFGLGAHAAAEAVSVIWPGGRQQHLGRVTAGQTLDITEDMLGKGKER